MERGAEQYVRLAADPTLGNVSGRYFVKGKEKQAGSSPLTLDHVVQQRARAPETATRLIHAGKRRRATRRATPAQEALFRRRL